jgi:hypothetical protein
MSNQISECHIAIIGTDCKLSENTITLKLNNFNKNIQHHFAVYTNTNDEFLILTSQYNPHKQLRPKVSMILGLKKYTLRTHISIYNKQRRIYYSANTIVRFS